MKNKSPFPFAHRIPITVMALSMALSAVSCANDTRIGDERGDLGKACATSSECGDGLFCDTSDPLNGLCTVHCGNTDECQLVYGLGSFCIGAERCVRECALDTDCLERTSCGSFSWCN